MSRTWRAGIESEYKPERRNISGGVYQCHFAGAGFVFGHQRRLILHSACRPQLVVRCIRSSDYRESMSHQIDGLAHEGMNSSASSGNEVH